MVIGAWLKRVGALLIIPGMAMPQLALSQNADSVKSLCAQLTDLSAYARENICPANIELWQQNHQATIPSDLTRLWTPEELQNSEQEFWSSLRQCNTSACVQDAYAKQREQQLDVASKLVEHERFKLEENAEKHQQKAERQRQEALEQQRLIDEQRAVAAEDQPKIAETNGSNSAGDTPISSESTAGENNFLGLLMMGIIVLPIFFIAGFCWQYVINTFIGPDKRIGYWPCILISFIPVIGQLVFPLTFICFAIRMLRGSVTSVNRS